MSHEDTAAKKAIAKKKKAEEAKKKLAAEKKPGSTASPKNHSKPKSADEWEGSRELPVKLTDEELMKFKDSILCLLTDADKLRAESANTAATYRAQIKVIESEMNDLRYSVRTGKQLRMVATREVPDFSSGIVTIFRCDNDERVEDRQLLPSERQVNLDKEVSSRKKK